MKRKLRQEDEEEAQETKMEIHEKGRTYFAETREENSGDIEKKTLLAKLLEKSS